MLRKLYRAFFLLKPTLFNHSEARIKMINEVTTARQVSRCLLSINVLKCGTKQFSVVTTPSVQ